MKRKHLVVVFLLGFCAGFLVRAGISTAQPLPAYAVSVDTVMQRLQEQQDLFLVDVREERQFAQVRIPGSLNIPLFAVKTKSFLKTKAVVLVDEGYRPHQLEETCDQLTQAGFEAQFLFGGLNAWRTRSAKESLQRSAKESLQRSAHVHVLPLQGDVFAQKALNRMPPQALFAEQDGKHWLLLDVSTDGETHPWPPSTGLRTGFSDNAVDVSPGSAGVSPAPGSTDILSASVAGETPALPGVLPGLTLSIRESNSSTKDARLVPSAVTRAFKTALAIGCFAPN